MWLAGIAAAVLVGSLAASAAAESTTVTSFDGTRIHVNFFPAPGLKPGRRAATMMLGPGWSQPGDTDTNDALDPTTGIPGVGTLLSAGFNVVTWDPRGFGQSGGTAEVDSPRYEGRDVSAIITWLAHQPQALLDRRNDPRVGMAGGSYGGGIQLVSAAIDPRIDAVVPDIAWHSLVTSLYKNDTFKMGWNSELYGLGKALGRLDPMIDSSFAAGLAGEPLTPAEISFYATRGPGDLVGRIHIPTLLVQGTVDNLFTLQEAIENYEILRRDGVPVSMLWFCGGHGICITNPGDERLLTRDTLAWLDRYLLREKHVSTGPIFEWVDQNGVEHTGPDYPLAPGAPLTAHGSGTLPIMQAGGAGPVTQPSTVHAPSGASLASLAGPIAPAKASNAVNVTIPAPRRTRYVVGAPKLTFTYRGVGGADHLQSTSIYAQMLDDASGYVLNNQITPIRVALDGATHTVSLPLEVLSATDHPGETFTLQLVASTTTYQAQRAAGEITFSKIHIVLPTVDPNAPPPGYGAIAPNGCTDGGIIALHLPPGTEGSRAMLGKRVIARGGRRKLTIRLIGLGTRTVRIKIVVVQQGERTRTFFRRLRACP